MPPRAPALHRPETDASRPGVLLDHVPGVLWATDRELVVTQAVGQSLAVAGVDPKSLVGMVIGDLPEAFAEMAEAHRTALRTGESSDCRVSYRDRVFDVRVGPMCSADGEVLGTIGTGIDVTGRCAVEGKFERPAEHAPARDRTDAHRAKLERRASERSYSELFELATELIFLVDRDGRISDVNPAAERVLGYSRDELLGQPVARFVAPEDGAALAGRMARKFDGSEQTTVYESALVAKDGRRVPIETTSQVVIRDGIPGGVLAISRDVSGEHAARIALEESERRFRGAFDDAAVGMFLTDPAGSVVRVNGAFATMLGYTTDELAGMHVRDISHPDDMARVEEDLAVHPGATDRYRRIIDMRYLRKDGEPVWGHVGVSAIRNDDGSPLYFVAQVEDVTELRRVQAERLQAEAALEATEDRHRNLFEHARDAIWTTDLNGNFTSVNPAAEQITGFGREELLTMNLLDVIAPEERERTRDILARRNAGGADEPVELQLIAKDGHRVFVDVLGRVVAPNGGPGHVEAIARDTTDRHMLEEELRHRALHDDLTGLPNRTLLHDRLDQALARSERRNSGVAVMLLDVDDFKLVNDSLGHAAGDELLVELAARLQSILRGSETVARLGGDEFALTVEGVRAKHELVSLAGRVQSAFAGPFVIGDTERRLTASLGIALALEGAESSDLLRDADTAMYRAKRNGGGRFEFFDAEVRAQLLRQLAVGEALQNALLDQTLGASYQPIVSLTDGRILAVEALARWLDPDWGWVEPAEFIPIAEQNGLIVPVGRYMLREAASCAAHWRQQCPGSLPLGMFVNVAPRELSQPDFVPFVTQTLAEHGLVAADIAFELTERFFIDGHDGTLIQNLDQLTRLGIRLILDDFGTGYSALASLKRFPLAAVKIDRDFIHSIGSLDAQPPVTRAIVSLGKTLGLTVIAEGVENELQLAYLRSVGCDAAQGFQLARPQPAEELTKLLTAAPASRRPGMLGAPGLRPAP